MGTKSLLVAVIVTTVSALGFSKSVRKCDVLPKPKNVISAPSYVTEKPCPLKEKTPPDKLQYKAEARGNPYFEEKESEPKEENGAYYGSGREVYVEPDPTFRKTDEPIIDIERDEGAPSQK